MKDILSNLGYGATTAVIGIAVVFVGLILIILSIYGISAVLNIGKNKKKEEAAAAPASEPAPAPAPVVESVPAEETAEEIVPVTDDNELIAVIAAAIAAMDGGSKPLVIRSVRRVNGWKNAARAEQVLKY